LSLRSLRGSAVHFDGRFFCNHRLFWPIARAASAFAGEANWPNVASYARAFDGEPPVRFEEARPAPKRARRRIAVDPDALYDARIAAAGVVPTRPGSWHDFLNALVWATFPRAKRLLHSRQHAELAARLVPGARTLPPTRTREHDALALLDEGGVVALGDGRDRVCVVFGHALYEGLVLGVRSMAARAAIVRVERLPSDPSGCIALADRSLEECIAGRPRPEGLPRIALAAC
jgi:hypothetical protein